MDLGIKAAVNYYMHAGWRVDYFPHKVDNDICIYAPDGSVFGSTDLQFYHCPFCNEDDPEWEESWCDHEPHLLDFEKNARNLLNLILQEPSLAYKNLSSEQL